jgi:hypothetical protein
MNIDFLYQVEDNFLSRDFISGVSTVFWNNFIKTVFWQVDDKIS